MIALLRSFQDHIDKSEKRGAFWANSGKGWYSDYANFPTKYKKIFLEQEKRVENE